MGVASGRRNHRANQRMPLAGSSRMRGCCMPLHAAGRPVRTLNWQPTSPVGPARYRGSLWLPPSGHMSCTRRPKRAQRRARPQARRPPPAPPADAPARAPARRHGRGSARGRGRVVPAAGSRLHGAAAHVRQGARVAGGAGGVCRDARAPPGRRAQHRALLLAHLGLRRGRPLAGGRAGAPLAPPCPASVQPTAQPRTSSAGALGRASARRGGGARGQPGPLALLGRGRALLPARQQAGCGAVLSARGRARRCLARCRRPRRATRAARPT